MAGIYTDKRDLTQTRIQRQVYSSAIADRKLQFPGRQETTSFRSGAQHSSSEDTLEQDARIMGPARLLKSPYDTGHEFSTFKAELTSVSSVTNIRCRNRNGVVSTLTGPIGPVGVFGMAGDYAHIPALASNSVNYWGSRAIEATAPTKSNAQTATMLGELVRDGLPSLVGINLLRDKTLRSLGKEYLNVEFGWKPLVSDLQAILKAVVNSTEILEQFRRDSGRIVRRRFSFPVETSSVETLPSYQGTYRVTDDNGLTGERPIQVTDTTTRSMWFSGAYSYYLDVGDELMSKARRYEQEANHLLGLRITPEVLWNLTPWSWLVDWFSNVGTALSNISMLQEDGLVIRWGYLMCHTVTRRNLTGAYKFKGLPDPVPVRVSYLSVRKERFRATPYGFGLNLVDLTSRQWAILAALGMTRAPHIAY